MLFLFTAVAKVLFRMGLDAGFLRVYYEVGEEGERRAFTFTIAGFAAFAGALLFGLVALLSPPFATFLIGTDSGGNARLVMLAAADVFLGTFAFVPLALLRIQDRPRLFATLIAARNLVNTVLKVVLVVRGEGVTGVLVSDVVATGLLSLSLLPVLARNASPAFRPGLLAEALRFGLPKAPHGLMIQLLNLADRKILAGFRDLATVGIYDKGYVLGAGVKFATSAFEPAWQPFVYGQIGQPDAPRTLARVVTYAWAGFVTLGLLVAVFGRELLMALTFTNPAFWVGAPVVPVVVLAYLFHGAFLLTSIGIGISKDTRYYPLITTAAAITNLAANFALIPRFGMMGAAWATVLAYAVMAACGFALSRRLYPIPFEGSRLLRLSLAAVVAFLLSRLASEAFLPALLIKTGSLLVFPGALWFGGFLSEAERRWVTERFALRPRDSDRSLDTGGRANAIAARVRNQAAQAAVRLTVHAHKEMVEESVTLSDLFQALGNPLLLEVYPEDRRGPSGLFLGYTPTGRALHVVCTTAQPTLIVITVYEPRPPKWSTPTERVLKK